MIPYFSLRKLLRETENQKNPISFSTEQSPKGIFFYLVTGSPILTKYSYSGPFDLSTPSANIEPLKSVGFVGKTIPFVSDILIEYTAQYFKSTGWLQSDIEYVDSGFSNVFQKILNNLHVFRFAGTISRSERSAIMQNYRETKGRTIGDNWTKSASCTVPALIKGLPWPIPLGSVIFSDYTSKSYGYSDVLFSQPKYLIITWSEQDRSLSNLSHTITIRSKLE